MSKSAGTTSPMSGPAMYQGSGCTDGREYPMSRVL
jgi:hypothetical protein